MRPSEVLDHQGALLDHLGSRVYRGFLRGYLTSLDHSHGQKYPMEVMEARAERLVSAMSNSLRVAMAYHVQTEMYPLLRAAAADMEGTEYIKREHLPAEHGFLMFDQPWVTSDVTGKTITYSAIQWGHGSMTNDPSGAPGIWLYMYSDINDEQDEFSRAIRAKSDPEELRTLGRLHLGHIFFYPYEQRVGPARILTPEEYKTLLNEPKAQDTPNDMRVIVALFRLLTQVLVEVKDAPIERAASRRARKARLPQRVQTIKLRRKEIRYLNESAPDPGSVDWQHQWLVRGHYGWRKCGPDHPLAEPYEKGYHAWVYVTPYWKGPEDKPVVITEKVWDLAQ